MLLGRILVAPTSGKVCYLMSAASKRLMLALPAVPLAAAALSRAMFVVCILQLRQISMLARRGQSRYEVVVGIAPPRANAFKSLHVLRSCCITGGHERPIGFWTYSTKIRLKLHQFCALHASCSAKSVQDRLGTPARLFHATSSHSWNDDDPRMRYYMSQ